MDHEITLHEQMILLSVWRLQDDAYGVTLRENVREITGREIHYGTLYNTLNKLVGKALVRTRTGEPTGERGGRRKIFYELTPRGKASLRKARELQKAMWSGISDLAGEAGEA